uniref:Uncharacterized protein n=1 Tax=Rhizophora mucronata TaxID=61149 RepID=A0A2P2JBH5_RHIMU
MVTISHVRIRRRGEQINGTITGLVTKKSISAFCIASSMTFNFYQFGKYRASCIKTSKLSSPNMLIFLISSLQV